MRIHRLRLQAFGPFSGAFELDFDALGAGGLHLIHGATGSGKTSILDAICFAVFGQVAGARRGLGGPANTLAPAGTTPEVDLEVTLAGRRLRFVRRPEHERPKKRGGGVTVVRSSVELHEWHDGRWQVISSRVQEVQHVVDISLGLQLDQFAQVIMLPQGGFAQFLHAEPDARAGVLRRLFDIERFADLEQWFGDRRRAAAADLAAARQPLDRARTVVELALAELPAAASDADPISRSRAAATPPDHDLGTSTGTPTLIPQECTEDQMPELVTQVAHEVANRATGAAAHADAAEATAHTARTALINADRTTALHTRGTTARRTLADLDAPDALAAQESARAELDAAQRAARVEPTLRQLRLAETDLAQAAQEEQAARADALRPSRVSTADTAQSWSALVHRAQEPVRSAARRAGEMLAALEQAEQAAQRRTELTEQWARLEARIETLRAETTEVDDELETAAADAARLDHGEQLARLVDAAAHRVRQLRAKSDHEQLVAGAVRDTDESVAVAARHVEALRRAHVAQVTGRLAADLVEGAPCAVCGSIKHPAPAELPATALVSQDDVDAADEAHRVSKEAFDAAMRDLTEAQAAVAHAVAEAELALASVRSAAAELFDEEPDEIPTEPDSLDRWIHDVRVCATRHVEHAREARTRAATLRRRRDRLGTENDDLNARLIEVRLDLASAQTSARAAAAAALERAGSARDDLERHDFDCPCVAEVPAARTPPGEIPWSTGDAEALVHALLEAADQTRADMESVAATVQERLSDHDHLTAQVDAWRSAELRRLDAAHRVADTDAALAGLLTQEGFTAADDALDALRPADHLEDLRASLERAERTRTEAQTVLADPDVLAVLEQPLPDAESLRRAAESAELSARAARDQASALERVRGKLLGAARDLSAALDQLRPLRERHEALDHLASLVNAERGAAGDRRMRLSAYVLAARLEEVVRLANERLSAMTDQRFTLEHDDGPGSRGSRGGLGLRIHDAWTGTARSTRSLSGGETFLASLALALALGDAIQQDTGGRQLETLFVDEGFGSLDEDSLELVLEVLDELRSGGRTIGIVSHVAELRQRIPAQIEVIKAETGSSLRVHLPGRSSVA